MNSPEFVLDDADNHGVPISAHCSACGASWHRPTDDPYAVLSAVSLGMASAAAAAPAPVLRTMSQWVADQGFTVYIISNDKYEYPHAYALVGKQGSNLTGENARKPFGWSSSTEMQIERLDPTLAEHGPD